MNIQVLLISLILSIAIPSERSTQTTKSNISSRDFFKDSKFVQTSWLGFLQSKESKKLISNIPMFIYENKAEGYGKIVCVPKALESWNAKFKGKTIAQKIAIGKTLSKGILNNSIGEDNFSIYSFFTDANDLNPNADQQKVSKPKFPSIVYIYAKNGLKWNLVMQKTIKTLAEYSELQYSIANGF